MAIPLKYNLRNLRVRLTATLMTAGGVLLVVFVVMMMAAFLGGMKKSLRDSGSPDNVIVLQKGATNEAFSGTSREVLVTLAAYDGIKRGADGGKLLSEEFVLSLRPAKKVGMMPFWQLRGVTPAAYAVHDVVRLKPGGGWPAGMGEIALGEKFASAMGSAAGATLELDGKPWRVTGIFTAGGSSLENELWMDLTTLRAEFKKNYLTSVLIKAESAQAAAALARAIEADSRVAVQAKPERKFYADQNLMGAAIRSAGTFMALLLGLGAVFGGMNTMFASVAARKREIGTLRALGFSRGAILACFLTESLLIALIGFLCAAPAGLGMALLRVANAGGFRALPISLQLSGVDWLLCLAVALGMGAVGGLLPALLAARATLVDALRG